MNKYQFAGKELLNLSADYSYIFRNVSLYGEVAQSRSSNAVAVIQGVTVAMGRRASITALYRNYPKDYHTFYAQGFGDGSNTNRSEEHTSELQSRPHLVCRLLLEKKNKN